MLSYIARTAPAYAHYKKIVFFQQVKLIFGNFFVGIGAIYAEV